MSPKIATNTSVDRAGLLEFVTGRHHMLLTTRRASGGIQQSPVTAGVDAAGRVVVASYPERAKVHNLRADPAVSLLVLSDEWDGPWVQVDGTAQVLDLPEALEPLVDYFRAIAGEHSDWDDYRAAMARQGKCLIRITPQRWGPIATGGFPARPG
jgi:PPOX class probable F420-dependent enzyme